MSPSLLLKAGALALAVGAVSAKQVYTLDTTKDFYHGKNFWSMFTFETENDPTHGFVDYQTYDAASSTSFGGKLIDTYDNGSVYMGVDYWNSYPVQQSATMRGRPSVRIESVKTYQHGLFVADLAHMPASVCGTWPAFWTVSHVDYPAQGEIDILENINEKTYSLETLHTSDNTTTGCQVKGNMLDPTLQSGSQQSYNCYDQAYGSDYGSQWPYQGCSANNNNPNSYGTPFNNNGGGVYAMEWTSDAIQIWNFGPNNVPANLANGNPDTSTWGQPAFSTLGGGCNIDDYFLDHNVVFDTTFCGDFAGQDAQWQATSCYANGWATCPQYVAANPSVFKDAYWIINSLKVYQKTDVVSTTSSTQTSTTTTSTTSSSKSTTTTTSSSSTSTTSSSTSSTSTTSPTSSTHSTSSTPSTSSSSSSSTISTTVTSSSSHVPPTSSDVSSTTSSYPSSSTAVPTSSDVLKTSSNVPSSSSSDISSTTSGYSTSSSAVLSTSSDVSSTSSGVPSSSSSTSVASSTASSSGVSNSSSDVLSTSSNLPSSSSTGTLSSTASITLSVTSSSSTTPSSSISGAPSSSLSSSFLYSNSSTSSTLVTTSTVYTTSVYTITSCAATVTDCPARLGSVTTDIISLYTTICPVTATETGSGATSTLVTASSASATPVTTSTVYTTTVYTITNCAATVTDCPAKIGSVTTETIALYTTVCPVTATEASSSPAAGTPSHPAYSIISSSIATPTTIVAIVKTETVVPVFTPKFTYTTLAPANSAGSNATVPTGTASAGGVSKSAGVLAPSSSPIYSASGASEIKAGGALMIVVAAVAMLL